MLRRTLLVTFYVDQGIGASENLHRFNDFITFEKINVMIAVNGVYENGVVRLDKKIQAKKSIKVIVTFLDEEIQNNKRLTVNDFSFLKSREKTKRFKGSLSDSIIEERRAEL